MDPSKIEDICVGMPDCPLIIMCYFTLSRYMPSPLPAVYFKSCSHCGWYPVSSADLCGEQVMFFGSDGHSSYCARNSNKRNFAGFGGWRRKHEPQVSLYGVGMIKYKLFHVYIVPDRHQKSHQKQLKINTLRTVFKYVINLFLVSTPLSILT